MRSKLLLVFSALLVLLLAQAASATTLPGVFERGSGVASVTGLDAKWTNSCAVFSWDEVADVNYVVQTSSNQPNMTSDVNMSLNEYTLCTLAAGNWVRLQVFRIDQNADGHFLSLQPDTNITLTPGTVVQSGQYMVFAVFVALGALIGLIILVAVVVLIFRRVGFNVGSMMK